VQVTIPRWAQAVLIPVAILVGILVIRIASHAVFVFLFAALFSLLLNPLVEAMRRARVPRAISVPLVYLSALAVVVVLVAIAVPPLVSQAGNLIKRIPDFTTAGDRWLARLQIFLAQRHINVDLPSIVTKVTDWLQTEMPKSVGTIFNLGKGVASSIVSFLLVVVISFYMLIDGRRIHRFLVRVLPGGPETSEAYLTGVQASFTRYVKGQFLIGLAVGLSSGVGMWILGWNVVNIWPEGAQYALLFGVWAGVTEVIPYLGPWLGALPPAILALFHSPAACVWVLLVFGAVQQIEGHVLVPNIMGTTVGVHPLVVIFALLAGAQVGGIIGMLAVLPILAILRHTLDFYDLRLSRAAWIVDDGIALPALPERRPRRPPPDGAPTASSETTHAAGPTAEAPPAPRGPEPGRDLDG
jgi:predicted PurR-regulated permease PerM